MIYIAIILLHVLKSMKIKYHRNYKVWPFLEIHEILLPQKFLVLQYLVQA